MANKENVYIWGVTTRDMRNDRVGMTERDPGTKTISNFGSCEAFYLMIHVGYMWEVKETTFLVVLVIVMIKTSETF
jgi:hypothetical protein